MQPYIIRGGLSGEMRRRSVTLTPASASTLQRRVVCPPGVSEEEGTGCYEVADEMPADQNYRPAEPDYTPADQDSLTSTPLAIGGLGVTTVPGPYGIPPPSYGPPSGPVETPLGPVDTAPPVADGIGEGVAEGVGESATEGIGEGLAEGAGEGLAEGLGEGLLAGLGAGLVGLGAGLATFLWSTPTAPPWMDELNPITGQPYKSQEEYDEVRRLRLEERQRRIEAAKQTSNQPTTQPQPTPQSQPDEPEEEQKKNCSADYPNQILCNSPLLASYNFNSEDAAFRSIRGTGLRKEQPGTPATSGPCVGMGGWHTRVKSGKTYLASIVCCPCCDDSNGTAITRTRCRVI